MSASRTPSIWAVIPAAGHGMRFGGAVPKQHLEIAGRSLLAHALDALLSHPRIDGASLALAGGDMQGLATSHAHGKLLVTCTGGRERADSVLAALHALPASVAGNALILVHDAARPNLHAGDIDRLIDAALAHVDGALLAAPVRDTLKRATHEDDVATSQRTEPRDGLWRALTPQAFRRDALTCALLQARAEGVAVTDEAMAMERIGARPRLVEGREDNVKVTTPEDLALVEFLLARRMPGLPS